MDLPSTSGMGNNWSERLKLMMRQFGYLEELVGPRRAVVMFRKMGHWYLKGMRVRKALRHQFQIARDRVELQVALDAICEAGPISGSRTGVLPEMHVPVPSGPVEKW